MARPSELTPATKAAICTAVRAGNYPAAAAHAAGIGKATYYSWMKRGRSESSGIYREFLEAIQQAERESEVALVTIWREHALKNWQAAAALLERRFPKRWLRPQHVQVAATLKVEDARDALLAKLERLALAATEAVALPSASSSTPALTEGTDGAMRGSDEEGTR